MNKIFIPDTNVLLNNPFAACLLSSQPSKIVLLKAAIEELDSLKNSEDGRLARQARAASRELEAAIREAQPTEGGWLIPGRPDCMFMIDEETDRHLRVVDRRSLDDRILACSQLYVRQHGDQVTLVTNDRNMRILAAGRGIPAINPSELVQVGDGRYVMLTVAALDDQKPHTFPIGLGDGETWILEMVPSELRLNQYHKQVVYVRLLAPGDVPETTPPWKFPDPIPLLSIWADEDEVVSNESPYALEQRASLHPESCIQGLCYREWKLQVSVRGSLREERIRDSWVPWYGFEHLTMEVQVERLSPEEVEAMKAYFIERQRLQQEKWQREAQEQQERQRRLKQEQEERQRRLQQEQEERSQKERERQEEQARLAQQKVEEQRQTQNQQIKRALLVVLAVAVIFYTPPLLCILSRYLSLVVAKILQLL